MIVTAPANWLGGVGLDGTAHHKTGPGRDLSPGLFYADRLGADRLGADRLGADGLALFQSSDESGVVGGKTMSVACHDQHQIGQIGAGWPHSKQLVMRL